MLNGSAHIMYYNIYKQYIHSNYDSFIFSYCITERNATSCKL